MTCAYVRQVMNQNDLLSNFVEIVEGKAAHAQWR